MCNPSCDEKPCPEFAHWDAGGHWMSRCGKRPAHECSVWGSWPQTCWAERSCQWRRASGLQEGRQGNLRSPWACAISWLSSHAHECAGRPLIAPHTETTAQTTLPKVVALNTNARAYEGRRSRRGRRGRRGRRRRLRVVGERERSRAGFNRERRRGGANGQRHIAATLRWDSQLADQ